MTPRPPHSNSHWRATPFLVRRAAWPAVVSLLVLVCHFWLAAGFRSARADEPAVEAPDEAAAHVGNAAERDDDKKDERRVGRLIRVTSPITDKLSSRVKRIVDTTVRQAKQNGEWPVFIFEIDPGRSEFGQAYELANFLTSAALNGATTVAYVPRAISGHAVLVALACQQIVMSEEASIGNAGEYDGAIKPTVRNAYAEIANVRKTLPADLALKMLDEKLELFRVETEVGREFVLSERLDDLREKVALAKPKVISPSGKPGVFSGQQLREERLVDYLAPDRLALAKALSLPKSAVEEDLTLDGKYRPVRIAVKGPISQTLADQVQNLVQSQIRDADANLIVLWIESPGGSPTASVNLANVLTKIDPRERRTVAYIPSEARGDAAFLALACDHIVMHPRAVLGGPGAAQLEDDEIQVTAESVAEIARQKNRPAALAAALVDPALTVYRYTRQSDGLVEYFSEEEARRLDDTRDWQRGEQVTTDGKPLRLTGEEAERLGLTHAVVEDFAAFKAEYGLEDDPTLVEPGWADYLIDALNSPGVSWFLLFLGGAALYAELQSPGIGLGGLVAALCFLLYFWSAYLGGTAGWLEVLMFLAGLICLLLEVFVLPGFGLFGLAGGILIIASLVLASQTFVLPRNEYQLMHLRNSLLALAGAGVATVGAIALLRRYLPHTPMFNRVLLAPPSGEELSVISQREAMAQLEHLLGRRGESFTPLVPGGKAVFDEQLVDVLTEGEFIDRGQPVEVVEVRGHRVVVRGIAEA